MGELVWEGGCETDGPALAGTAQGVSEVDLCCVSGYLFSPRKLEGPRSNLLSSSLITTTYSKVLLSTCGRLCFNPVILDSS